MAKKNYRWILNREFRQRLRDWRSALSKGSVTPGKHLEAVLKGRDPAGMTSPALFHALMQTRKPAIFAESEVRGDGSDWTFEEMAILGDVTCAMPVTVFDNGLHHNPRVHEAPFSATLLFVSGALLRNDHGNPMPDFKECVPNGEFYSSAYEQLIARRIRPLLTFANEQARKAGRKAVVTVPGIGCGQFAGGVMGISRALEKALIGLLTSEGKKWAYISCVYYDSYGDLIKSDEDIHGIAFRVRPLLKVTQPKPQLCHPQEYEETAGEFLDHDLFSLVAWDPVSWPGNDFYIGNRTTDDGVKAAATNAMKQMTGIQGSYNPSNYGYEPSEGGTWETVIRQHRITLETEGLCQIEKPSPVDRRTLH